ncbi:uncharacterized protein LOC144077381 [Stigmatopora argus]
MDPEKTLTFCLGIKSDELTMTLKYLVGPTEASTVAVIQKELDRPTVDKVEKQHEHSGSPPVASHKYCPGINNNPGYVCETGHCCGETGCCTYYYELWWFWLLWTVLILFCCFCAYRHRRAKLRIQQQQRQREINLIAYNRACSYPPSMLDLSFLASFKLPTYDEVAAQPSTPPPTYSSVFALQGDAMLGPNSSYPHHHLHSHPCPPYMGPAASSFTLSQSSDNYTSCSCESCFLTSPCSTSSSIQVTDETYDSSRMSTPNDTVGEGTFLPRVGGIHLSNPLPSPPMSQVPPDIIAALTPDIIPSHSYNGLEGFSCSAAPLSLPLGPFKGYRPSHPPRLTLSPLIALPSLPSGQVQNFIYSNPLCATTKKEEEEVLPLSTRSSRQGASLATNMSAVMRPEDEDEDEDDDEEDHFRHRRLTGDSGIEVCRCKGKRGDTEEDESLKERQRCDSVDSSPQAKEGLLSPLLDNCLQPHGDFVIVVESSVV